MSVTAPSRDVQVLRELAERYMEVALLPVQQQRREQWTHLQSLQPQRPLIRASFGMWNVWCREVFADAAMECGDPLLREIERRLRMTLLQHEIGDDTIIEPWLSVAAVYADEGRPLWGVSIGRHRPGMEGGAWMFDPPLKSWDDVARLRPAVHGIDEGATAEKLERIAEAIGDIIPLDVTRWPRFSNFQGDISTELANLRGLEQVMMDMVCEPGRLHELLALMRDAVMASQDAAEAAGHYSSTTQKNQSEVYAAGTTPPRPNGGPAKRANLWCHCAAQEFTGVSPAMHDEFLLQYQLPIIRKWGLVTYGCCEDLTRKIDMLRQIPNLRMIAVTPRADVASCAEQIGADYVISWRPNPTDMVCSRFDEAQVRRIVGEALAACRGQFLTIHLKDIETVEGEPGRLARWSRIVKEEIDRVW